MARYRTVQCLIWNDDKFPFLPERAKLIFFHLLTTPLSTPFGCYKAGVNTLAEDSRIDPKEYREGFDILFQKGLICYDEKALVVLLPNFLRYNPPANPNVVKNWEKVLREVPNCDLKSQCIKDLEGFCTAKSEGFAKAFRECFLEPF